MEWWSDSARRSRVFLAGGLLGLVLIAGSYWLAQGSPPGSWVGLGTPSAADPQAAGKALFAANCARCHTVGGSLVASPDGLRGPDLAAVAADPSHTRQWLIDYVSDPQGENRLARMPKFEGKLTAGQLLALADYLASLRAN
jgi:mono/diheme cytochrome c family protein